MTVAIVTDSTNSLPASVLAGRELHVLPLWLVENGEATRESEIGDLTELYRGLRDGSRVLSTSQPSVGEFIAIWEPLLQAGRDICSVHITSGMSGTVSTALQARDELAPVHPDRQIAIVDSGSTAGGLGLAVLAALKASEQGLDLDGVVERTEYVRDHMNVWFGVDTLDFLIRGGRIGRASGLVGSALKIRPILKLDGGAGAVNEVVEKVRTSSRMRARMAAFAPELDANGNDGWIVMHVLDDDAAAELVEAGRAVFGTEPLCVCAASAVVGAHTGPGLLGIAGAPRWMVDPLVSEPAETSVTS